MRSMVSAASHLVSVDLTPSSAEASFLLQYSSPAAQATQPSMSCPAAGLRLMYSQRTNQHSVFGHTVGTYDIADGHAKAMQSPVSMLVWMAQCYVHTSCFARVRAAEQSAAWAVLN